ncbi:MAG: hypothetical protein GY799_07410 [Desulfobulbaceae bacterium]|nr:hypothetical protein [Desulfobulbaceae bacterium]
MQEANLTIHLLDQWPGRPVDDLKEQTYPRLQAESATNHNSQSKVWVPDHLIAAEIEDEEQAAWLEQLERGERKDSANFQFIRSNRQALINQVLQTIAGLQENVQTEEPVSFLIDTHQKDQRYAFTLAGLLAKEGVGVEFNQESSDPVKSLGDFEKAVCQVQNLVIMFGKVNPKWLKARIQTTVKVIANQLITESSTLCKIWVLLLPGCPGQDAVPSTPLLRVSLLDNTTADEITADHLQELLAAGQGRANS